MIFKKQSKKRSGKYGVAPKKDRTHKDGTVYMSKLEMNYRKHLDLLKKATSKSNKVVSYKEQVPMEVFINGIKIYKYLLDFQVEYADGRTEYIDVKGILTSIYRLKKKGVEAYYGIKIKEVKRGDF